MDAFAWSRLVLLRFHTESLRPRGSALIYAAATSSTAPSPAEQLRYGSDGGDRDGDPVAL